ncbi:amidase [Pseudomonas aeruginosa]|nr:amidase [Pseudomonas aeruginosa]
MFAGQVPEHDAIVVERVKSSGAIVIGKTNVPEFGLGSQTYNPLFGTTRNAYDPARIAGGSSGGAAVALALRMLPVADGSDMMGSLRNPAAYNNVYGFRPSQGRVPHGPQAELFVQQLATEGPMGRSVADLARLLATQAGYDPRCPLSLRDDPRRFADDLGARLPRSPARLARRLRRLPADGGGRAGALRSRAGRFRRAGLRRRGVPAGLSLERLWRTWLVHRQWLVQGSLGELYADPARRVRLKPEAQWEVESGLGLGAAEVYRASLDRSDWYRALARLFERYDFLLLPSAQVFPFDAETAWPRQVAGRPMDTYHRWMEVVIGPTLAGLPAISVPIGFGAAGLPMGLQIIGPAQADLAVLQLAHAHEGLTRWVSRRPPAMLEAPGGID